MAAGRYTVQAEQGATLALSLTWKDPDGNPIDLLGYTARLQVRRSATASGDPLLEATDGNGITLGGEDGVIAIEIPAETMADVPAGDLRYDLELDSGSQVTRLLEGVFKVSPEVTR